MAFTALQVANLISQKVNHMDAQAAGNHPILSEIYAEMSATQRILAGKYPWTWLNDTITLDGFDVSTDEGADTAGFYQSESASFRTSPLASKTEYFAQSFTADADYLSKPLNIVIPLEQAGVGAGAPSGTLTLMICPDDGSGAPDIANPEITADALTPTFNGITVKTNNIFLFTANTVVLLKNTTYWYVLKWVGAADNGDAFYVCYDAISGASTTTYSRLNNATTWTAFTAGKMCVTMTYYKASYAQTLTLPATVEDVFALYTGDLGDRQATVIEYSGDRFIKSGYDLPIDTFAVRKVSGGQKVIYLNPSIFPRVWTIDVRLAPVTITADADTMLVPDSGIDYIIYTCAANFISGGLGTQDAQLIQGFYAKAAEVLIDMEDRFLPKPSSGRRVIRSGRIARDEAYSDALRKRIYGR